MIPVSVFATSRALEPETLIMAMPPLPGGVAIAAIVSSIVAINNTI